MFESPNCASTMSSWCSIKHGILIGHNSSSSICDKVNFCKSFSCASVCSADVLTGVINSYNDSEKSVVTWSFVKALPTPCGWPCCEITPLGFILNASRSIPRWIPLIALGNCAVNASSVLFKSCFIKNASSSRVAVILSVWGQKKITQVRNISFIIYPYTWSSILPLWVTIYNCFGGTSLLLKRLKIQFRLFPWVY